MAGAATKPRLAVLGVDIEEEVQPQAIFPDDVVWHVLRVAEASTLTRVACTSYSGAKAVQEVAAERLKLVSKRAPVPGLEIFDQLCTPSPLEPGSWLVS